MENILMIPLHGAGFAPFGFLGPLVGLLVVLALLHLFRRGRLGPIRYEGRQSSRRHAARTPEGDALDVLRVRLANGDITPEEYMARTSVLSRPTTTQE